MKLAYVHMSACVCVRAHVRACVRACMHACTCITQNIKSTKLNPKLVKTH